MHSRIVILAVLLMGTDAHFALATSPDRPNVLLILVDDLKPTLGCYGDQHAITPNIDRLATQGLRFNLAYCNQAVCAPSRFTLMLGSHSTSTGLYDLGNNLRRVFPDAVTLPQHFGNHGYQTHSIGKVFHVGHGNEGDERSFSVPSFKDKVIEYLDPESTDGGKLTREEALFTNQRLNEIGSLPRGAAFEAPDVDDQQYADGRVANEAIMRLKQWHETDSQSQTPFLMAVGFVRPHLPFSVPKKYWDLYDPQRLPLPVNPLPPRDVPLVAMKRGGEITAYKPVPVNGQVDRKLSRQLIHGYYAGASFVDAQIGKVLDELKRLELDQRTIVVLWGDHGYHLGDLGIWTKHTNFEQANRIPLLIVAPEVTTPNSVTNQLAESVDLFPTLASLCGLPAPSGPQTRDGIDLTPVLKDTNRRLRDHAYHAFPHEKLGRAIRTERYRLVQWKGFQEPEDQAIYELYDYELDPHETTNQAASHPEVVKQLREILDQYPPAVPPRQPRRVNPSND